VAARYWRLYIRGNQANPDHQWTQVASVEMMGVLGGPDLCTGGTPIASSDQAGAEIANLFDHNAATFWGPTSGNMPCYAGYIFANPVAIRAFSIQARNAYTNEGTCLWNYSLEYSTDGIIWTNAEDYQETVGWVNSEIRIREAILANDLMPVSANFAFTGGTALLTHSRKYSYTESVKAMEAARYWRLGDISEEGANTGFAYEEMVGNHGNLIGTMDYAPSLLLNDPNSAIKFTGANQAYIESNYTRVLADRTLSTTLSFIAKLESGESGHHLISTERTSSHDDLHISITANDEIVISINAWSYAPYTVYYSSPMESFKRGVPNFIAIVLDKFTYSIYVEGILIAEFNADHVFSAESGHGNIEFGRHRNSSFNTSYTDAVIDEVAIFEKALTAQQIFDLYFAGNDHKFILRAESAQFSFNGFAAELTADASTKIIASSANFAFQGHPARSIVIKHTEGVGDGSLAAITGDARQTPVSPNLHVREPIYNGEDYPPANWQCAPGSLPGYGNTGFYPCPDHSSPPDFPAEILIGEYVRNDRYILPVWTHEGVLTRHAQVILSGCYVTPKEIFYDTESAGDQHFNIVISNNDIGRPLLVESMTIWEGDHHAYGMEILEADFLPMWIPAYSYQTFTLVIYGSTGNQKIDAVLEVRVGTCDTDIPITGLRLIECPKLPEPCQPCPEEEVDMAQCMIEQALCAISRGDSVPFSFRFTESGEPLDITGMTLQLTLKEDIKQKVPNLIKEVVFPDNINSQDGLGGMTLTPEDTMTLRAGITYCFKFKLINGPDDISTIGLGTIPVNPDPHAE